MEKIFLIYSLQVSITLLLFYLLYILLLKKSTFLKVKRIYLYFAIVFSLLSPCVKLISPIKNTFAAVDIVLPTVEINNGHVVEYSAPSLMPNLSTVLMIVVILGITFLSIRMLVQLLTIFRIKFRNEIIEYDAYPIICVKSKEISSFSFFRWIFISNDIRSDDKQLADIIRHEKVHVDQKHSFDTFIAELLCVVFWWNPIVWKLKNEIVLNLEYLADEGVLAQGVDSKYYQYLLLQTSRSNASIQLINNFNVSQLKNRIIMMNKEKTSSKQGFRYLLVLPLIAVSVWFGALYAENADNNLVAISETAIKPQDERPYEVVEEMPQFPGGMNALMTFIGQNLRYPIDDAKSKVEGRVLVRFVIEKDGTVNDVEVLRSLSPNCDAEAVRVVKAMPKWSPGIQKGKEVRVYFTLPILYKLTKNKPK